MPLESDVDFLGDLDPNSPGPAEFKSEGDDHFRNLKKALRQSFPGATGPILVMGTATGPADAYVLTPARPLVEYRAGMLVAFQITAANATTAPTLNISSLGAKTVKAVDGAALAAGDMPASSFQFLVYNGADFVQQAPSKAYIDRIVQALRNYVDQLQFSSAFPNQAGNARKVITTDGTNVSWDWPQSLRRSARTANASLGDADRAWLIEITSGTFTQTFDAAATLGNGWYCYLSNSGTGTITLDPTGAETIDGKTSYLMYPGEMRLIQCDGISLRTKVLAPFDLKITSTQNFNKPPGYKRFDGILWGAGASGTVSTSNDYVAIAGSGGAAAHPFSIPAAMLADVELVTIAAASVGPSTTGNSTVMGATGGQSSFAGLTANGGQPGNWTPVAGTSAVAGAGGTASNTSSPAPGGSGGSANDFAAEAGGPAYYGGAGSGGAKIGSVGAKGISKFGGNAGASIAANSDGSQVVAENGAAPGGAGGACRAPHSSGGVGSGKAGDGGRGELQIRGVV